MAKIKLLLDTDIILDYLCEREPHYADARKLMILGYLGEFELWVTPLQVLDLLHRLSDGGKSKLLPHVRKRIRGLRTFINVHAPGEGEVDRMLAGSDEDPRAALLQEVALYLHADAIITREQDAFSSKAVWALDCPELFDWLEQTKGVTYEDIDF